MDSCLKCKHYSPYFADDNRMGKCKNSNGSKTVKAWDTCPFFGTHRGNRLLNVPTSVKNQLLLKPLSELRKEIKRIENEEIPYPLGEPCQMQLL